jgi:hypothetical protein
LFWREFKTISQLNTRCAEENLNDRMACLSRLNVAAF